MVCEHLRQLYQLCVDQKLRLGGSDLIHLFCEQCGRQEICPSTLRYSRERDEEPTPAGTKSAPAANEK
jgi:hypothetical protein